MVASKKSYWLVEMWASYENDSSCNHAINNFKNKTQRYINDYSLKISINSFVRSYNQMESLKVSKY